MTLAAAPARAYTVELTPEFICATDKEAVTTGTTLLGPDDGATVRAGTPVTFSAKAGAPSAPLKFRVASSPALLSSPDIDSGQESPQPGGTSAFTSTRAAATPRRIYWAASLTVAVEDCPAPFTYMTPARTLTVVSAAPASIRIEKVKVAASALAITLKASHGGSVTITGSGLRKIVRAIPSGSDRLTVPLTKAGEADKEQHKRIGLEVSLKTGSDTVSSAESVKL